MMSYVKYATPGIAIVVTSDDHDIDKLLDSIDKQSHKPNKIMAFRGEEAKDMKYMSNKLVTDTVSYIHSGYIMDVIT